MTYTCVYSLLADGWKSLELSLPDSSVVTFSCPPVDSSDVLACIYVPYSDCPIKWTTNYSFRVEL